MVFVKVVAARLYISFYSAYQLINERYEPRFETDFQAARDEGCVLNCPKTLAFPHKSLIFRMKKALLIISLVAIIPFVVITKLHPFASAQDDAQVKAVYTKTEQMISMRDGVKLFTSIYSPKDQSKRYPIMLNRTPYSVAPYGKDEYRTALGPSPLFQTEQYIFVYQDVRGKFMP